ncbi:MAG: LacI family DNA-binding transcriptional regulator, partial [Bacteroidota bacterium]|nr:LacI family DNA-binding transcriptional regulator [Bacteroidota bacterium]
MKIHQVTIKDIANILGISISTVSRALKNHPDISEETKNQVKELAVKLNYEPNALALNLRRCRTNTIGVIIPEIVHHFFSSVISGIEDVAYDRGYNVMVCQSNESYEREKINAQALLLNRVDGVLVSVSKNSYNFDHIRAFVNQGIPLVFFDRICPEIIA